MHIVENSIIYLDSPEDIESVPIGRSIRFICSSCGKENTIKTLYSKDKIRIRQYFMCGTCSRKLTNLMKYGAENAFGSEIIKQRIKATNLQKYGVENPSQSDIIKNKKRQTTLKNYGVECPMQSEEVVAKIKQTNLAIYGFENPAQSDIVKEKIAKTNLERYNSKCSLHSDEVKKKTECTCLRKYGTKQYMASADFKRKSKISNYQKYGNPTPYRFGSPEYKNLMISRYGSQNPFKLGSQDYMNNMCKKYGVDQHFSNFDEFLAYFHTNFPELYFSSNYVYNGQSFDSKWELAFYIYYTDNYFQIVREPISIKYIYDFNIHRCFPDFLVNNQYFEIKGDHFFKPDGTMFCPYRSPEMSDYDYQQICNLYEAKHQAMLRNNVIFLRKYEMTPYLDYINYTYGPNYLDLFNTKNKRNMSYGYTPFNYNPYSDYQEPIYKGLTPFDDICYDN